MKTIYLASYKAEHPNYDIVYQDINNKRDIGGDMLDISLSDYDVIIATPPCNYYSKANYRRDFSLYSLRTRHLLPCILIKLYFLGKPFIVENVRNKPMFLKYGLYDFKGLFIYEFGRHTYFTNIKLDLSNVEQVKDNVENVTQNKRQGSLNVHNVIEKFLYEVYYGSTNYTNK